MNDENASQFDQRLFQSKVHVVSINESRFDQRQEQDCNYCLSAFNLLSIKSVEKYIAWQWIKE